MGGTLINQNESIITNNKSSNAKKKIIKRYQNRKLYDTQQSCYVTLDDIAKMIRANEDVMVIDNKSKNDITAGTLTQIIFEAEKKASQYAPLFTLREIIQSGNSSISNYLAKLGAFPREYITRPQQINKEELNEYNNQKTAKNENKENKISANHSHSSNVSAEISPENKYNSNIAAKIAAEKASATILPGYEFEEDTPSLPTSNHNSLNN